MLLYWIILPIVWVLARLVWRIEVIGLENYKAVRDGRAFVIASNHIANLDPVFIAIAVMDWRRMCVLAKEELFKNPFIGWFLRCMGAVEKVTNACRKGVGVLIFPEGTRTKNGKLGILKSGAFVIAASAGADMLPCRIIYNTKDGKLHLFCRIRVVFGPAIPAAELQITDAGHKVTALRHMKSRLKEALELLLEQNAFDVQPAQTQSVPPEAAVQNPPAVAEGKRQPNP